MVAGKPHEIGTEISVPLVGPSIIHRFCFLPAIGNPAKLMNQFEAYSIGNTDALIGRTFDCVH